MDRNQANRLSCVICGIETKRHSGWFLVMDNCWLDRVKVLSWHPNLAQTERARAVCGKLHLKMLLTHWLNHASLQLVASNAAPPAITLDNTWSGSNYANFSLGRVVGELAVERDPRSPGWTGSPEAMKCILATLIGDMEARSPGLQLTSLEYLAGYSRTFAFR